VIRLRLSRPPFRMHTRGEEDRRVDDEARGNGLKRVLYITYLYIIYQKCLIVPGARAHALISCFFISFRGLLERGGSWGGPFFIVHLVG